MLFAIFADTRYVAFAPMLSDAFRFRYAELPCRFSPRWPRCFRLRYAACDTLMPLRFLFAMPLLSPLIFRFATPRCLRYAADFAADSAIAAMLFAYFSFRVSCRHCCRHYAITLLIDAVLFRLIDIATPPPLTDTPRCLLLIFFADAAF